MSIIINLHCRCFNDVKTAVRISTANGMTTGLDLEVLLENSGLVRQKPIFFSKFYNFERRNTERYRHVHCTVYYLRSVDWCNYSVLLLCEGNDILHLMTHDKRQRLRVDFADFEGNTRYAEYDCFRVDSVQAKYRLASLGRYTGNAGIE